MEKTCTKEQLFSLDLPKVASLSNYLYEGFIILLPIILVNSNSMKLTSKAMKNYLISIFSVLRVLGHRIFKV
jgi:hypothetical protein